MAKKTIKKTVLPDEVIINKIYLIREQKVMLDKDLAEMYGIDTKVLKQAVKRNAERVSQGFYVYPYSERVSALEVTNCDLKLGRYQVSSNGFYRAGCCHAFGCFK